MKLYTWSGFPQFHNSKVFVLANSLDEAREVFLRDFSKHDIYDPIRKMVQENDPVIYDKPYGWAQEVGPQHT